jgi:hypothetical protein
MLGEIAEGIRRIQAECEIGHHVLKEDDGRRQPVEHLHLGIDQQLENGFHVLRNERPRSQKNGGERALGGQELL